ncbi:LysR family transcriptional regulator [Alicyclobacillus tengchongensis]|nr:LysR family transcriptional regulator [Alicyclobacillus tengchongensis]
MMTELRQLEYFVAVAEELHFGRAAKRLGLTQPPLSQQIRQLEGELGVRLLDRTNRKVRLTDAGMAYLQEVRQVLARLQAATETARRAASGAVGKLVVGFVGSATYDWLPPVIRRYQELCPGVELILREMPTPAQMEALLTGAIDVGVLRTPAAHPDLHVCSIRRDECVVVLPVGSDLAAKSGVHMEDLQGEPLVLVARSIWPGLYDSVVTLCRAAGFGPTIRLEVTEVQTAVGLVAAGMGVSILPKATQNVHAREVRYVPIEGPAPVVELGIAWRRDDDSSVVQRFLQIAQD